MRRRIDLARLTIAAVALLPAVVVLPVAETMFMLVPDVHFWLVAVVASIGAGASLALTVSGARGGDGRAILLGTAFSTMTALFAVHGLATPGVLVGPNGVIAAAGGLSMPVGAVLLALTALPALRRPRRVRPLLVLQATTR